MTAESAAQETGARPRPKRRRWFLRVVWLLLLPLAGALLALAFFLGTEPGLRAGYALVQRLAPGLVEIARLEGRVAGELQLEGVRIRTPAADVDLGRFHLHWQPWALLRAELRILDLSLHDLAVTTQPSAEVPEAEAQPLELPTLVLPLSLELERGLVEGLSIAGADGAAPFAITRIEIAAAAQTSDVTVHRLSLVLPKPEAAAEAQGQLALRDRYPLDLRLTWELEQPPKARLAGQAKLGGDLRTLQIAHELSGSAEVQLQGTLFDVLNDLRWQAELEIAAIDLPAFQPDLPVVELASRLTSEGSLAQATLAGELRAHAPDLTEYGHVQADLALVWKEQQLVVEELRLREVESGAGLAAKGRWKLQDGPGEFAWEARWDRLGWPLLGDRLVDSERGQLAVEGTLDGYRYQLDGQVRGPDIPATSLRAEGEGDLERTRIRRLDLDTLEGRLGLQGELAWVPALTWEAALDARDINPGSQWGDWPGRLNGRVTSQGALQDEQLELAAAIETLEGRLRGYPVKAAGKASMRGTDVRIDDLALSSGPSRLRLAGDLGQRWDLTFDLDSPDLRSLLPDAAGAVKAGGSLRGSLEAPEVKARLQASGVQVAGQRIDQAGGSVDLGLGAGERVAVDLKAQGLELGGMPWSDASIQGQGKVGDHRLQATLTGEPLTVGLQLSGALGEAGAYQGELRGLELRSVEFGDWRLAAPARFRVAGAEVAAGPLCLQGLESSRLCTNFDMPGAGRWQADMEVERLPLALLAPFLPEGTQMEGAVQAKAAFKADDNVLSGEATLSLPRGTAYFEMLEETVDFSNTRVEVSAARRGLQARLSVPLAGLGGVDGDLRLDGWSLNDPAGPSLPLRGRVKGGIKDLSLVTALVPQLDNVRGRLGLDMRLGGTLGAPEFNGTAGLQNAGFEVPMLSLNVQGLEVAVESRGFETLDINGQLKSGAGVLRLTGGTRVEPDKGMVTRLQLKGKRLTAVNTPEYFALVSPDVQVQLDKEAVAVTGEIFVPEARIRPRSVPEGSVSPSSDVVIETGASAEEQTGLPTAIDLVARLGQDVSLNGFGVEGDLEGRLRIFQRPGRPQLLGDGQLSIVDGTYRLSGGKGLNVAIGRPLTIKQGRLLFAKSPLDNPGLLLLVEREAGDVTAGMRVSGTLKNPKMTFFSASDPGMSQSEALNYMLTGKGSMGQTSGEDAQQGIAVGTYVAPKLYMEYENEPEERANKVRLRYDLTDKVQIQTETGDQQGIDIFYKIER